jgi:hypothetical protein
MNQTPAGWYPDPNNPQLQRYWDGAKWTEHEAPAAGQRQAAAPAAAPATPAAPAAPSVAQTAQVANPYDKFFNVDQLPAVQREAYKQHSLTEFAPWAVIVLTILTLGIFGVIYHGLKHSQLPVVKEDDFGAGKGIGFLFIPFFNLYWVFVFWLRLVDRINFQYRLRGAAPPVSRDLALAALIVSLVGWILFLGWVGAILALVVAGQIQSAANRLARGEVQPLAIAPAAAFPQPAQPVAGQPPR